MDECNYMIAVFIARVFLGVLFFMQGYDKVFKVKMNNVIDTFKTELGDSRLPAPLISLAAYYTSYVEMIGGLFLIFGFMKNYALYALGIDLILVAVAMSIIEPLWKMDYVFPRLVLLLLLLIVPTAWDFLSIDSLLSGL